MKILFLTNLSEHVHGFHEIGKTAELDCSARGLDYPLSLLNELGKLAHVDVYSPPLQRFVTTAPMKEVDIPRMIRFTPIRVAIPEVTDAETLNGLGYDIVIAYAESIFAYLRNWNKLKTKKVLWFLSSPTQIAQVNYDGVEADLALKVVDKAGRTPASEMFARRGLRTEWLPFSVDVNRFKKEQIPKIYDICLLGNLNPSIYPLRLAAFNHLAKKRQHSMALMPAYGEDYVKTINQSRLFLTCSGIFRYPVMKYFEAMACGTLLLADTPMDADELGFVVGKNFISIEGDFPRRLDEALDYYLTHVNEANAVGDAGELLIHERHTDRIRARELYGMLERL